MRMPFAADDMRLACCRLGLLRSIVMRRSAPRLLCKKAEPYTKIYTVQSNSAAGTERYRSVPAVVCHKRVSRAYASIPSMISSSCWLKGAASSALMFSSICSGRLAPMSAEVTTLSRSTHASAICDSFCPRC